MNKAQRRRRRRRREAARAEKRLSKRSQALDFRDNFSAASLWLAAKSCRSGVTWKRSVQRFMASSWGRCVELSRQVDDGRYHKTPPRCFFLTERGKRRLISPVCFRDRVVERATCTNVLLPLLEPEMSYDNAASRVGKGAEFARERLRRALSREARAHPEACVVMYDFHNYFGSIPNDRVMAELEGRVRGIADADGRSEDADRLCSLLRQFVCESKGLGLGNQTSQVCAIWWASPIDHWLSEVARAPNGRYMDDGWAIFPDRESALRGLDALRSMSERLGLELNERKTRVVAVTHEVTYLKCVFRAYPTGRVSVRVLSSALKRWRRHSRSVARLCARGEITSEDLERCLASRKSLALRCPSKERRRLMRLLDKVADECMAIASATEVVQGDTEDGLFARQDWRFWRDRLRKSEGR